MADIIPWGRIEKDYEKNFHAGTGAPAKISRMAFGALYIKERLGIYDEEIRNPQVLDVDIGNMRSCRIHSKIFSPLLKPLLVMVKSIIRRMSIFSIVRIHCLNFIQVFDRVQTSDEGTHGTARDRG